VKNGRNPLKSSHFLSFGHYPIPQWAVGKLRKVGPNLRELRPTLVRDYQLEVQTHFPRLERSWSTWT